MATCTNCRREIATAHGYPARCQVRLASASQDAVYRLRAALDCSEAAHARTRTQLDEALAKLAAAPWQPAHPETERERALQAQLDEAKERLALTPDERAKVEAIRNVLGFVPGSVNAGALVAIIDRLAPVHR